MGQWGLETCSGDSCWDCLEARDIHNMKQKEADFSVNQLWENKGDDFDKLGVVIWILSQGLKVDIEKLNECLIIAQNFSTQEFIDEQGWRDKTGRKKAVLSEIELIETSIQNKGVGEKRHIVGLLDKMH